MNFWECRVTGMFVEEAASFFNISFAVSIQNKQFNLSFFDIKGDLVLIMLIYNLLSLFAFIVTSV